MRDDVLRSTEKILLLLESLSTEGGTAVGVTELSHRTGISKSTTFRLLQTLERFQLVENWRGKYVLSDRLSEIADGAYTASPSILRVAVQPWLQDLYERTHEIICLDVLAGIFVVRVALLCGHRSVGLALNLRDKIPAATSVTGKTILAYSRREICDRVATSGFDRCSKPSRNHEKWYADLEQIRRQGISLAGEPLGGNMLLTIAAPILNRKQEAVAALAVTGLSGLRRSRALAPSVRSTASAASLAVCRALEAKGTEIGHSGNV